MARSSMIRGRSFTLRSLLKCWTLAIIAAVGLKTDGINAQLVGVGNYPQTRRAAVLYFDKQATLPSWKLMCENSIGLADRLEDQADVYSLCWCGGVLYAGATGGVWKYIGNNAWEKTDPYGSVLLQNQEMTLASYGGVLYAGFIGSRHLFQYSPGNDKWSIAAQGNKALALDQGILSLYEWNGDFYIGDNWNDDIDRFVAVHFHRARSMT